MFYNLNLIRILKGFKPFGENPKNSSKLYHDMAYTNIILDDITCIADFKVPSQAAFGIHGKNYERFQFEFGTSLGLGLMTLQ
jgi:hypothetical protein